LLLLAAACCCCCLLLLVLAAGSGHDSCNEVASCYDAVLVYTVLVLASSTSTSAS
jgi:hypothetical protein